MSFGGDKLFSNHSRRGGKGDIPQWGPKKRGSAIRSLLFIIKNLIQ
jgi:hypothetical protein